MIEIKDKRDCCGCAACVQICPKHCISLKDDTEGFLYPLVNKNTCIDCKLCEHVCPCINQNESKQPLLINATFNKNEKERIESSSGGLFSVFARYILDEGGVIFGARFDEQWNVIHDYAEDLKGLSTFRGSKYVQSNIGDTYKKAQSFLKSGRKVLFSGTPCQIAGLNKFLRKQYDNLLTIEVVCHGVPSPSAWKSYLDYINPQHRLIKNINLRDKSHGWKRYSYLIEAEDIILVSDYASSSLYLKGFSLNLTIRPSCYKCPAKEFKSAADVTLADCWGVEKLDYYDDDKGISIVICNSTKAISILQKLGLTTIQVDYEFVKKYNPAIYLSSRHPYCRHLFWQLFPKHGIQSVEIVQKKLHNPFFRMYNYIRTLIK